MNEETRKAIVDEISKALTENLWHNTMDTFMQLIVTMNRTLGGDNGSTH